MIGDGPESLYIRNTSLLKKLTKSFQEQFEDYRKTTELEIIQTLNDSRTTGCQINTDEVIKLRHNQRKKLHLGLESWLGSYEFLLLL